MKQAENNSTSDHDHGLVEPARSFFEELVKSVFRDKRELFVHSVMDKLSRDLLSKTALTMTSTGPEDDWIEIESLSRLRSIVGGRFKNLKDKWLLAGLPLREHRGDRQADYEVREDTWVELSNWIAKQGYEARLAEADRSHVMELRKVEKD